MYIRTVTWTRPSKDVQWPWVGLDQEFEAIIESLPGLLHRSGVETDTTYTYTAVWETEQDCINQSNHPVVVAMNQAQEPVRIERGITKEIVNETINR